MIAQHSDDDLVELARRTANDEGAFEELYRRHEAAARNIARHILRSRQDADDVVNEAFAGVIAAIGNGAGPRTNFRQYLMACVRNSCKARRWSGTFVSTDPSVMEQTGPVFEDPDRLSEQGLVASAFSSLSPDWQLTLWLTAVEERPAAEVAERLGRRPNAVAALAHRAREAFAEAYLAQHQTRNTSPACTKISPKLAHYVRGNCGDVDAVIVERHLVNCVPCSRAVDELRDLNASLRTLTGPGPVVGAGAAAVGASAAMVAGFAPLASSLGGWSLGSIGGASLVKAAVIGALIIPAAAIVSTDVGSDDTARSVRTQQAVSADDAHRTAADGGGSGGAASATGVGGLVPSAGVTAAIGGITDSVPTGDLATTLSSVLQRPVGENPPITATMSATPSGGIIGAATLPAGGGTDVGVGIDPSRAVVTVAATVPLVTISLSATVFVPLGDSGVGTPPVSTSPIVLPAVTVAGVTIPSATLLPAPSTTTSTTLAPLDQTLTTLSPVTLSPVTLPPVTLSPVTLPPVTLPPVTRPPLVVSLFG